MGKWLAGIAATVIAGLIISLLVNWLTPNGKITEQGPVDFTIHYTGDELEEGIVNIYIDGAPVGEMLIGRGGDPNVVKVSVPRPGTYDFEIRWLQYVPLYKIRGGEKVYVGHGENNLSGNGKILVHPGKSFKLLYVLQGPNRVTAGLSPVD